MSGGRRPRAGFSAGGVVDLSAALRWFHWRVTQEPASAPASPPAGGPVPGGGPPYPAPDGGPPYPAPDGGSPYPAPPPGYVWVRPTPPPTNRRWRVPLWLKILTGVWTVALVIGGGWYALHGEPSVREQTSIGDARPVVDRTIVDVVAAAGGGPVVAVSGFDRVKSCKITPVRSGAEFRRVVDLYTSPGSESAILHMIASGLPARYHAQTGSSARLTLDADAGDYVAVDGTVPAPGLIRIKADTGCRQDKGVGVGEPSPAAGSPSVAALAPVLGALGRPAVPYATVADLACPSGGSLRSVAATLPPGSAPASLATTLRTLAPTPAAASRTTYAFRSGAVDVVAVANPASHAVTVTATTRCSA